MLYVAVEIKGKFYCLEDGYLGNGTPQTQEDINNLKLHPGDKVLCETCEKVISTEEDEDAQIL